MTKLTKTARWSVFLPLVVVFACLVIVAISFAAPTANQNDEFKLTILHTNDLHAHDESFSERGRVIGGFARLGHLIRLLKEKNPQALVIDAGDIFQGTPLFTRYHGEVEVSMLNKMGYDIYTIGNHEFDDGPDNLAKQLQEAKFKIISCNLDCSREPKLAKLVQPSCIKEINGQKVGFIGVMTPDLMELALNGGGVTIKSQGKTWMQPIADEISKLKGEGVNKIILVTHCGVDYDKLMAENLPDVDAIIGGHSHTRLDKAIVVPHGDTGSATIVQTGCFGRTLGKLDLTFDKEGKVIDADTRYHLFNITDKIQEEPELKTYVEKMAEPLLPLRKTLAGTAEGDFDNRWTNTPWDSALGDLICDALAEAGKEYGVTISFENRGGIRGRIDRGPITLEKVEEILPFDNKVVFATIPGADLMKVLEHSVEGGLGGKFLEEHGLKVAYDPVQPRGERIVFALTQDKDGVWRPLAADERYKISINDYSFKAGEGFNFEKASDTRFLPDRISVALNAYLKRHPNVMPQPPSRIVPVCPGLLEVKKDSKGKSILLLKGGLGNSRITLVAGTSKGIGTIQSEKSDIPVPIFDPTVVQTARCDQMGEYTFALPLKLPADNASTKADGTLSAPPGKVYVAAIIQAPRGIAGKRTLISYPLLIER